VYCAIFSRSPNRAMAKVHSGLTIGFALLGERHTFCPPSFSVALECGPAFGFKQHDGSVDKFLKQRLDTMLRDQAHAQLVQGVLLASPSSVLSPARKAALIEIEKAP
jgi:glycyl-tRNA synthetase beta subunit